MSDGSVWVGQIALTSVACHHLILTCVVVGSNPGDGNIKVAVRTSLDKTNGVVGECEALDMTCCLLQYLETGVSCLS